MPTNSGYFSGVPYQSKLYNNQQPNKYQQTTSYAFFDKKPTSSKTFEAPLLKDKDSIMNILKKLKGEQSMQEDILADTSGYMSSLNLQNHLFYTK